MHYQNLVCQQATDLHAAYNCHFQPSFHGYHFESHTKSVFEFTFLGLMAPATLRMGHILCLLHL
jgi:hypothetical protein